MSAAQPITAEDLAAALVGFSVSFTAALVARRNQSANEMLDALANELHELAAGMTKRGDAGTPAAAALGLAGDMLMASEIGR